MYNRNYYVIGLYLWASGNGENIYFRELIFAQRTKKDEYGRIIISPSTKRYEELVLPEFNYEKRHQHVLEKLLTNKIHNDYVYEDENFFDDIKNISKLNPNILFKIKTLKIPRPDDEENDQPEESKYNVYVLNGKILIDECLEIYKHSDEQSALKAKDWID